MHALLPSVWQTEITKGKSLLQVHLAMYLILLQAAVENNQYLNKKCKNTP